MGIDAGILVRRRIVNEVTWRLALRKIQLELADFTFSSSATGSEIKVLRPEFPDPYIPHCHVVRALRVAVPHLTPELALIIAAYSHVDPCSDDRMRAVEWSEALNFVPTQSDYQWETLKYPRDGELTELAENESQAESAQRRDPEQLIRQTLANHYDGNTRRLRHMMAVRAALGPGKSRLLPSAPKGSAPPVALRFVTGEGFGLPRFARHFVGLRSRVSGSYEREGTLKIIARVHRILDAAFPGHLELWHCERDDYSAPTLQPPLPTDRGWIDVAAFYATLRVGVDPASCTPEEEQVEQNRICGLLR